MPETTPSGLIVGQVLIGPLFREPVRVETLSQVGPDRWSSTRSTSDGW